MALLSFPKRKKGPLVVVGEAMMRNWMRKRFGVSMGQLGKMICSHTKFKVGHLGGGIRP